MTGDPLLRALRERALETIRNVVPPGPVALLDFPDYANPGDSAIWLGALDSLASSGFAQPAYTCGRRTFDERALRRALPGGTLLFSGGGNLGDLWPAHQSFREYVAARFHDYPIIQLPQSIHFTDASARSRARSVLASHPDYTIMVRDEESGTVARDELGCRAVLCPDLALCLTSAEPALRPGTAVVPASRETLWLLRTDHESAVGDAIGDRIDWVDEPRTSLGGIASFIGRQVERGVARGRTGPFRRVAGRVLSRSFPAQARARVRRGCRIVRSARVVITDRLHGHILSLLCDIPHVVLGDRNGKVRRFIEAWTADSSLVHWADTPADATAQASEILARIRFESHGNTSIP